jgi:hypothetical protein
MKIDLQKLEGYDHVAEKEDEAGGEPAKFFFKGTRSWFFQFGTKFKQVGNEEEGFMSLVSDVKSLFDGFVEIMVGWENLIDSNTGLRIQFNKVMARRLMENFQIFAPDEIVTIIMTVWKMVGDRENLLKNLQDGTTTQAVPTQDGSINALHTGTTRSRGAKAAKQESAKS